VNPDAPMTNDDVIQMVDAKVSADHIIAAIRTAKGLQFTINAKELTRLTQAGVPKSVIDVMIDPKKAAQVAAPASTPAHSTPKQVVQAAPAPAAPSTPAANTPPPAATPPAAAPQSAPVPPAPPAQPAATQPQQVASVAAPAPANAPKAAPESRAGLTAVTIGDRTGFHITLAVDIAANAKKDSPLRFTVTSDVVVFGDKVAIHKGAVVTGAIVDERKKGLLPGIGGKSMTFKLSKVDAADRPLLVRAEPTKGADHPVEDSANGKVKSTDTVAAPAGTEYVAYIDGDQTVTVDKVDK